MTEGAVSKTTNAAAGTVSGAAFIKWLVACIAAHEIVQPDETTLLVLSGSLVPFAHVIYLAFSQWLSRKAGVPLPINGGSAP